MKKLENTNDQSQLRRQALDSPLCTLIKKSWREFDEEIKDSRLSEEVVLRYVLWAIEMIKGGEVDIDDCCKELRHSVLSLLREKRIPSEEIDFITNTICAYTLLCFDQAFLYSKNNDLLHICTITENSIKKNQIEDVQKYKKQIRAKLYLLEIRNAFQEWCSDYLLNDRFYTTEDAEWIEEEPTLDNQHIEDSTNEDLVEDFNRDGNPCIHTLLKYCLDIDSCRTIVQTLSTCTSPDSLKNALLSIDETGNMIDLHTMDKIEFCRDIVPILGYNTNASALKQVIHRLCQPKSKKNR